MKILELKEKNLGLYKKEPHYNTYEFTVAAQHFKEFGVYTRHPVNTSPSSMWYKFWVEEARRCIYGYNIGRDWIPGYFYWYLNYCPIEKAVKEEDVAKESIYTLPESALSYSLYEKDKSEYSLEIPTEDEFASFKGDRITAFPDFWESDYETFHYFEEAEQSGEHAVVLKTRGRGFSFKGSSMLDRNFYLIPRSKSYAFASEKEYLISDGILTKAWDMMGHIEEHTPWGKRKSKIDTTLHKRASYLKMKQGVMTELGFGSEIIGVTFKNNPDRGRGKRGRLIIWEEFGKFMNGLVAWNIMLKSMAQGRITHGLSVSFGTGGSDIEDMMALEQLFIRGDGYKVHMIPNRFEPEMGYDRTALFIGEHRNHEVATDKDGNSHEDKALAFIEEDRRRHLEKTKNREMHIRYKAEAPIKPSEALTIVGKNPFPVDLLKQQKAYLLTHKESILAGTWIGSIGPDPETGEIRWYPDKDAIPIDHFPHNDIENLNGCVTIWEPPAKNREGKVPDRIYVSGNDNYDHDDSTTDSLGSTFIINRVSRRIVAEYTGRPATASMFYKTNMDLLVMYNSLQNFENNLQGLRNDARKNHMEDMLCDTPDIIKDKIDDKRVLNRIKGTPGTTPIKKYGRELILDWLLSPVEPGSQLLMLNTIRSIPLLEELIYYNPSGNFDRIDALLYTMILMEDMFEHIPAYEETQRNELPKFFKDNPLFSQNQGQGRITRVNNKIMIQQQGIVSPFKKYFE